MATLSALDRSRLERATLAARAAAEAAVRKRFDGLDLTAESSPTELPETDRALWRALRARARALGQGRVDANLAGTSAVQAGVPFLVEELAYEAWHRMLFARFLVENVLLTHPDLGVTLSVGDITALATEVGEDSWELATRFASHRLPGLFHLTEPLRLASEDRQDLARTLTGLDNHIFTAADALGWTYQFWQSQKKKEVNASGRKIGGADLSPVTQLFTEDYMVRFLLENSLGAWWAARHPDSPLLSNFAYLRFADDGTPASGSFPGWPDRAAELTVMDPCCGSGHFLVAAFEMLHRMRMEEEGLTEPDAADAVLRDNLFGLELDARCTQLAAFAVALSAWKAGGHPENNPPRIACSGTPVAGQLDAWRRLARGDINLRETLEQLHGLFAEAPTLGSLIDPRRLVGSQGMFAPRWEEVERALDQLTDADEETAIFAHAAEETARAALMLGRRYTLVATNVPYLSRGSQDERLKAYATRYHDDAKGDLATIFVDRCLGFCRGGGTVAVVTPLNWYSLGAYRNLRNRLLTAISWVTFANLGPKSFQTPMWDFNVAMSILNNTAPPLDNTFAGLDVATGKTASEKDRLLRELPVTIVSQQAQLENPDQRISLEGTVNLSLLERYAGGYAGIQSGDYPRFGRCFWELRSLDERWTPQVSTVERTTAWGGREHVFFWENGNGAFYRFVCERLGEAGVKAWIRGTGFDGRDGVAVSSMSKLPVSLYAGELFDNNTAVILPKDPAHLPAIWAFCSSPEFNAAVRRIDTALKVTNATLVKVPFDLERWQKVADDAGPLPEPHSDDPTQWLFKGHPAGSTAPLQVAVARLLGYRWPNQADDGLDALADPDGIVCLPSLYQEPPAHQRLADLLRTAYSDDRGQDTLSALLREVGAPSLEAWLRAKTAAGFFAQHVKLFHNRPFLWQITDGRPDGFAAVVNYHRLDAAALSKLIYTYLGEWVGRQERAVAAGEAGAPGRLDAATILRAKLVAIAEGEPPHDVYVRWKPLAEQPIGWQPDLNDGVRLNIRPFIEAGVLAARVNAKWGKDRGADPAVRAEPLRDVPESEADLHRRIDLHASVDRHNDLHFSRAEEERARQLASAGVGTPRGVSPARTSG